MKKGLFCIMVLVTAINSSYALFSTDEAKKIIENLYTDISGFRIKPGEADLITEKGGAPTYGEITFDSMQKMFDEIKVTKTDIFYDLGCGVGKTCVQAILTTRMKKSVGVELSPTRIADAHRIKAHMQKNSKFKAKTKKLEFREDNITTTDIADATIIYMSSLCFSDALMKTMTEKLAQLKPGLRVITMRKMPDEKSFTFIKEYKLPMSWSEGSPLYLYELKKKS